MLSRVGCVHPSVWRAEAERLTLSIPTLKYLFNKTDHDGLLY